VADFGIAKWLDESGITRTGEVMGSPGYLAPERLEGIPASPSSDLYSVGVLLYEALTGRRLAAGDHAWVAAADREGAVTPLVELRPDAGPALDQIVARAMSPDPSGRFASAEEMMKAIESSAQATVPIPPSTEEVATTARIEPAPSARARTPVHASARPSSERDPTLRSIVIAMAVGATALLILLVVAFAVVGGDADPPTAGATGASVDLPAPLAEALDRLEGAIP
jgi:eukaryotic-like serine/threonine-protein kinase